MRVVNVAIGHHRITGAASSNKRGPVSSRRNISIRHVDWDTFGTVLLVVHTTNDLAAIFKVIFVLDLLLVAFVIHIAHVEEYLLTVRILGHCKHRIGCFALIFPLKSSANGHRSNRMCLIGIDGPTCDVQLMRALVVQVAVTGQPKPMPVVVNKVSMKLLDIGWTAPHVPIQALRWIRHRLEANRAARLAAVPVRDLQATEFASVNRFVEPGDLGIASILCPVLDHYSILGLSGNTHATFTHIVAHRLFDVDVLACLSGPNGNQRMPVIGRCDRDGI